MMLWLQAQQASSDVTAGVQPNRKPQTADLLTLLRTGGLKIHIDTGGHPITTNDHQRGLCDKGAKLQQVEEVLL